MTRVVTAGVPMRKPEATKGLFDKRNRVLLTVMWALRALLGDFAVDSFRHPNATSIR